MAHMWDRGVLTASSWHGLEEVGVMLDAEDMIAAGENCGSWPIEVDFQQVTVGDGLPAPEYRGVVGKYRQHSPRTLGIVGGRYRATFPEEWRKLVRAVVAAGGKPTGTFSLCGGSRILATFEVGVSNGLKTQFILADSYDGSLKLTTGSTTVRVVCANTLSIALRSDGEGMANLRHVSTLEENIKALEKAIGRALETGENMRSMYKAARERKLTSAEKTAVLAALVPIAEDAPARSVTRAQNVRDAIVAASKMAVNEEGEDTLASLWNGCTYIIDRDGDAARPSRGKDNLNTMLFGPRGARVKEIQTIIEVILRDGTIAPMTVSQAIEAGVSSELTGRAIIKDMLEDLE